ncbi:MAG: hypothetical protein AAFQ13_00675 [Pseudomonadota bacterium]
MAGFRIYTRKRWGRRTEVERRVFFEIGRYFFSIGVGRRVRRG